MTSSWIKALYAWFIQQRSSETPISGPLLQIKSIESETFLNAVKHKGGGSQIQSINWLSRKV